MEGKSCILYISSKSWCDIREQLNKKQQQNLIVEKEKELKQMKRRLNEEMTKAWPDSKQNLSIKKEQERVQRLERIKQDRIDNFYKLRAEQAEKRKEFVEQVRRRQYLAGDLPRQLDSALLLSACLYERDKQIEFKKFFEKQEIEANNRIINGRLLNDKEPDKRAEHEKRAEYGEYLRQEMSKMKNNEEMARKKRLDQELTENQLNNEQMEIIKNNQMDKKRKLKAFYRQQWKDIHELKERLKQQEMLENQQFDTIIDSYKSTKDRIDCLRKKKEEELRKNLEKRQDVIREKLIMLQQQQQTDDDDRIRKQQEELFKKTEQQHLDKLRKKQELKQQRIDEYERHVKRVNYEKQLNNEYKKWEMLNRFKNSENEHESKQKQLQAKLERIQCYQRELVEQIANDEEAKQRELKANSVLTTDDDEDDRKFHEYANEVLEFARKNNFPIVPIEKAVKHHEKSKK